jgi:biotin carboxylase
VRGTYKWPSDAFFRQIVGGSTSATTFSDEVFKGSAEIQMKAPKEITGAYEYSLTLDFPNVVFQMTNPRLAGANIITTDIIGTAVATAGSNFMTAVLQNGSTAGPYTWPT